MNVKNVAQEVTASGLLMLGVGVATVGADLISEGKIGEGVAVAVVGVAIGALGLALAFYRQEPLTKSKGKKKK